MSSFREMCSKGNLVIISKQKKYFYIFFVRCIWRVVTRIVAAPKNAKPKIEDVSTDRVGTVCKIKLSGCEKNSNSALKLKCAAIRT